MPDYILSVPNLSILFLCSFSFKFFGFSSDVPFYQINLLNLPH